MPEPSSPIIAGRYQLESLLGRGGMGEVWRARDLKTNRRVAVKLMGRHIANDPTAVKRFEREMVATTMLEHPNTVRVYDFGRTDDDDLYLVMELVEGATLAKEIFDAGPLAIERVTRIGEQIARALVAAHANGVIHRDLKSGNVMLRNLYGQADAVTVLDFGIAHLAGAARLTSTDLVAASAPYCSPEQANGETVDARSDLYMLGVVLYECVAGRLPFEADNHLGFLYAHVHKLPDPPSVHRPDVPRWLDDLILMLLAKRPDDRPESAEAVAAMLARTDVSTNQAPIVSRQRVVVPTGPKDVDTNHETAQGRPPTRRRWLVATIGSIALGGLAAALILGASRPESVASPKDEGTGAPDAGSVTLVGATSTDVTEQAPDAEETDSAVVATDTEEPDTVVADTEASPPDGVTAETTIIIDPPETRPPPPKTWRLTIVPDPPDAEVTIAGRKTKSLGVKPNAWVDVTVKRANYASETKSIQVVEHGMRVPIALKLK